MVTLDSIVSVQLGCIDCRLTYDATDVVSDTHGNLCIPRHLHPVLRLVYAQHVACVTRMGFMFLPLLETRVGDTLSATGRRMVRIDGGVAW